jgi:hypothetical protein
MEINLSANRNGFKIGSCAMPGMRFVLLIIIVFISGCKKLVQIGPPKNTITIAQVFADSANASSAIAGIYDDMIYGGTGSLDFGCGAFSIYCGLSADEMFPFYNTGDLQQINSNSLNTNNATSNAFWIRGYTFLYQANAAIEGLLASTTISQSVKNQFTGEAKWFRAFIDFNLVNLYGGIPLVNSSNYTLNQSIARSSPAQVYQAIIEDLKDAQNLLPADFAIAGGEKIRVNKWAATALLARAYLYAGDYPDAYLQANAIINNSGMFSLDTLNGVFLRNSTEAILQWQNNSSTNVSTFNLLPEEFNVIPQDSTQAAKYYLTPQFLKGFESGDMRKSKWTQTYTYTGDGNSYTFPYKYKVGPSQLAANAPVSEYYMVLRLAEQYLIRAECEANGASGSGGTAAAIADLNVIRNRAGLPDLSPSLTGDSLFAAIAQERRSEFFAEWGHRWFDLKRTNQANNVLSIISYKQPWKGDYELLYPISRGELQTDPNLVQNPGY